MKKTEIISIILFLTIITFAFSTSSISPSYCQGNVKCILILIKNTNNTTLCQLANNSDKCFFEAFLINKNLTLCQEIIENTSLRETCIFIYSKKDPKACQLSNNQKKCYIERAISNKNISICNYLNTKEKAYCIYSIAYYTKNLSLCNLTSIYKRDCIYMIKNETH